MPASGTLKICLMDISGKACMAEGQLGPRSLAWPTWLVLCSALSDPNCHLIVLQVLLSYKQLIVQETMLFPVSSMPDLSQEVDYSDTK